MGVDRLGEVIARGSRSTVHTWGADAIAKVPLPATPSAWLRYEATYTAAVHAAGAPAQEFLGFGEHDSTTVSIYRRVRGENMWDAVLADPSRAADDGRRLADVQAELAAIVPPLALPAQGDRLRAKIRAAATTPGSDSTAVLDAVPQPSTHALCHGDLHPSNVILTSDGPILIDWFDASRGDPLGDIARTTLLLAVTGDHSHLAGPRREADAVLRSLHDSYLAAATTRFGADEDTLARWRAVGAVARLAEGVDAGPLLDVWNSWQRA